MKAIHVQQLDEKSEEIVGALISLGMRRHVARTLRYLQAVAEATSVEPVKGAGLHQSEVPI